MDYFLSAPHCQLGLPLAFGLQSGLVLEVKEKFWIISAFCRVVFQSVSFQEVYIVNSVYQSLCRLQKAFKLSNIGLQSTRVRAK